jgi:hypothetical protein
MMFVSIGLGTVVAVALIVVVSILTGGKVSPGRKVRGFFHARWIERWHRYGTLVDRPPGCLDFFRKLLRAVQD